MIDWTRGYECTWRFSEVDMATWASMGSLGSVTSATYEAEKATDSVETGTLTCILPYSSGKPAGWFRIEGLVQQGTSSTVVTVATLLFSPESSTWAGGMRTDSLRGVSGMAAASDADNLPAGAELPDGEWAAKGSNGSARVAELIGSCTPAPIVEVGQFSVSETVVFDLDAPPLAAAKTILDKAGWIARPNALGEIEVMPMPSTPIASFGAEDKGLFKSTASSDSEGRITYTRAWSPVLKVWDVFTANLPEIGLDGTYRVYSQRVTCGKGITVEETVEEVS